MSKAVTRVCLTVNNYSTSGYEKLQKVLVDKCKYAVIGKEVGEQGTRHLQGFIILKKKTRLSTVTKFIEEASGKHPYTTAANGKNDEAAEYCKKDGVFWEHGCYPKGRGSRTDIKDYLEAVKRGADDEVLAEEHPDCYAKYTRCKEHLRRAIRKKRSRKEMAEQYDDAKLRTWQRFTLKKLMVQNDRTVTWVYDEVGNMGKSWLANYMIAKHKAYLVEGGKRADIAFAYDYEEYVVFDFTRSQEEQVNYSTIESFKNGRIFSSKYESGLKQFNPCKVLCLSNFYPDKSKLSDDRWQILEFPPDKEAPMESYLEEPPKKRRRLNCQGGNNCNCGCTE